MAVQNTLVLKTPNTSSGTRKYTPATHWPFSLTVLQKLQQPEHAQELYQTTPGEVIAECFYVHV